MVIRIIYNDQVQAFGVPDWGIQTPEYNISLLEPDQTYKVRTVYHSFLIFKIRNYICALFPDMPYSKMLQKQRGKSFLHQSTHKKNGDQTAAQPFSNYQCDY